MVSQPCKFGIICKLREGVRDKIGEETGSCLSVTPLHHISISHPYRVITAVRAELLAIGLVKREMGP